MKILRKCCGFTLMEVNLAIFIMAVGVLGMVALYPLGFREGTESRSDVIEATLADGILNPLVAGLSATNMTWNSWKSITADIYPSQGWLDSRICDNKMVPQQATTICGEAQDVITKIDGICPSDAKPGSDAKQMVSYAHNAGMACALVISRPSTPNPSNSGTPYEDQSRLVLALRIARDARRIFESPVFYAEVRFQGLREKTN